MPRPTVFVPQKKYRAELDRIQKKGDMGSFARLNRLAVVASFYRIPPQFLPKDPMTLALSVQLLELLWFPLFVTEFPQMTKAFSEDGSVMLLEWLTRLKSFFWNASEFFADFPRGSGDPALFEGACTVLAGKANTTIRRMLSCSEQSPIEQGIFVHEVLFHEFITGIFRILGEWMSAQAMAILTKELADRKEEMSDLHALLFGEGPEKSI
jgi:hypothetical protein